ncbi:YbaB/EbfC family nucleoid-associated protein [Amycolatopsis alkalitolerans]|uniref:YbaB/EbfC family nucleoid-associated protein n=1 Tax=Amycolatopsis alkalitolerans TaxID=2547244 RepID=A0A5C4LZ53_9PSEU|nr:YbaB/EbfC family nucleoid-associated protein [Amycolatopsis alkalitolerans]TNC23605.1 YbaB/EbfC family nucleoid-associated protein [Amycolatopsis alkalitolerans]
MTITGSARRDGISVEVLPGGALRAVELTAEALEHGGPALARTILALVGEAAAQANQRAKHAMAGVLGGLSQDELTRLGLTQEESLTEVAEATTPEHWRV